MSSYCYSQYCGAGCCNYYGYCPTITGNYLQTSCYYYYYYWTDWWLWYVIGAGIFLFLVIVGSIIGCCVRRRRLNQMSQNTVVIDTNASNQNYNIDPEAQYVQNNGDYNPPQQPPNYFQANNAAYELGNMNNQPYVGQPVYPQQPNY